MTGPSLHVHCEAGLAPLADLLALDLRLGDVVGLRGELGAGKTTFARHLVRALFGDDAVEVPSPTFSLAQTYATPRLEVTHFDLFRLSGPTEVGEIGFDEAMQRGAVLVEWPERAAGLLPADRLEIKFTEADGGMLRRLALTGYGRWRPRHTRLVRTRAFLEGSGWGQARVRHLQGDASTRRYARLTMGQRTALLMDAPRQPDGPAIRDGKSYSRIAHLAEDIRPFVAVARALRQAGLSAPEIFARDLEGGLLIIEDLGDQVYGAALEKGGDQRELWRAAVDVLLALRRLELPRALPLDDGPPHVLPRYDLGALRIEVELLVDWYWPAVMGTPAPGPVRAEFLDAWGTIFDRLVGLPTGLLLRDYHSPNLIWLPERAGIGRVGVIDFQDALLGAEAYDLVSLLQDARLEVTPELEAELLAHYVATAAAEPGFDREAFMFAYRALGAQRNTKILGIFARLARRDGKPAYLQHIPRIWRYLERDLAPAPLQPLRAWYDRHLPAEVRERAPDAARRQTSTPTL